MIRYFEDEKIFSLTGKNYEYLMGIDNGGFLQHLYFGEKIGGGYAFLSAENKKFGVDPASPNMDTSFDTLMSECASFGRGDYRGHTLSVRRADGTSMSRFRFKNYEILSGVPDLCGLPHARKGDKTLVINLKDDFSDIEVGLYYLTFENSDALVRFAEIRNEGKSEAFITRAYSFCIDFPFKGQKLVTLSGSWAQERFPKYSDITSGVFSIGSTRGKTSHIKNCFMGMLDKNATEDDGECFGFGLMYSGSFILSCELSSGDTVRIEGGISDIGFEWKLSAGEKFATPQAVVVYSGEGLGGMSRTYSDFYRDYVINPDFVYRKRPVVLNSWEAVYFTFDTETIKGIIDATSGLGIDTFVMDDGWFGKRNDDKTSLGDWFVNEEKLRGGLKPVIDYCKSKNLKFGLWIEPEMISEKSDLYAAHPEFAVGKRDNEPSRSRTQLVLDFSNEKIVDYVYGVIDKILTENDISYVKWDMNRDLTDFYSETLGYDRQGEFSHRYALGVYRLAEKLTTSHPEVFFEGCAGGGGRFDGGMLYYFPQIWTSDNTDAADRAKIQYGTSLCYPLSAMSCHVSVCPNHQTSRVTPFNTRRLVASLGATGYELDPRKLGGEERETVKGQIKDYEKISELVLKGDLYRLKDPFEGEAFAFAVVSKDKKEAYVVYEAMKSNYVTVKKRLKIAGLAPDAEYEIAETGVRASGKAFALYGVALPKMADYEGFSLHLRKL